MATRGRVHGLDEHTNLSGSTVRRLPAGSFRAAERRSILFPTSFRHLYDENEGNMSVTDPVQARRTPVRR